MNKMIVFSLKSLNSFTLHTLTFSNAMCRDHYVFINLFTLSNIERS